MSKAKRKKTLNIEYEKRTARISLIDTETTLEDWDKKKETDLEVGDIMSF